MVEQSLAKSPTPPAAQPYTLSLDLPTFPPKPTNPQPLPPNQNSLAVMYHLPIAIVFPFTLFIYLKTMFPTVPGGDAGELLAEACHLGTAHPPGYPLFTILMHIVSEVGVNVDGWTPAAAANTACCLFGATTAVVLSQTAYKFIASEIGKDHDVLASYSGALCGVLFALSPLTWEYSVGAEVFALHNTLVAFILYFTVSVAVDEGKKNRLVSGCLGALFCGLAISNQHTSILFIACLVPYVAHVIFVKGGEKQELLGLLAYFFVMGLAPYLYLVWASGRVMDGSWGDMTR